MANIKQPNFFQALLPLLVLVVTATLSIMQWKAGMFVPLILGIVTTVLLGLFLGYKWADLEQFMTEGVTRALLPLFILLIIGLIVGTWILSGVIPTIIYYSLEFINPSFFIPAVALITGVLSVATGSSFTSIATIGLAFMVVGQSVGFPPALVAGAVMSGAYFGDKLSPLSDTTNVAPAVSDTDLFSHIKHMMWDTIPAFVIAVIIYIFIGLRFETDAFNLQQINEMMNVLDKTFNINPLLLLLPVITIVLVVKRFPVLPTLLSVSLLAAILALVFQGSTVTEVINVMTKGYVSDTGFKEVDSLLSKGGITSMFSVVTLILLATSLGGILEGVGVFKGILSYFLEKAQTTGSLILLTIISTLVIGFASGALFLALILSGRAFANEYKKRGLDTKNLSRSIEAAGTVGINFVPWSVNAVFAMGILGVHTLDYLPYSFFILLIPLINVIYGFTGFSIAKKAYSETDMDTKSQIHLNKVEETM